MMTFSHSHKDLHGNIISQLTYTLYEDSGIHDVMQEFRRFLLAVSFQPETVNKYIEAE